MTRLRFTLAQLMAIVLYVGFGFAALRNADEFWASATSTLAIVSISAALVGAIVRKGRSRTTWTGFAVFAWTYLLVGLLPPRDVSFPSGGGLTPSPRLLIEWGCEHLQSYIYQSTKVLHGHIHYLQISHSLGVILFGLVGAIVGRLMAGKDERPNS
jgi:hypothetical protein